MAPSRSLSVFDYLDYRHFLRDYYREQKRRRRGFSFRLFSKHAGLGSPNYLKLVMEGKRNLTPSMATRFASALRLEGDAAEYFQNLVGFGQATASKERDGYYRKLTGSRKYQKAHRLDIAQAQYHSEWYIPAIRELSMRKDFRENPDWLATMLLPAISPKEAEHAIHVLLELGLFARDPQGRLRPSHTVVSTGSETAGVHITRYHRTMLSRADEAIDLVPAMHRDISSITLCVGKDGLHRLKERIRRFRREILNMSATEGDPTQVVQINFQLFPLSVEEEASYE